MGVTDSSYYGTVHLVDVFQSCALHLPHRRMHNTLEKIYYHYQDTPAMAAGLNQRRLQNARDGSIAAQFNHTVLIIGHN